MKLHRLPPGDRNAVVHTSSADIDLLRHDVRVAALEDERPVPLRSAEACLPTLTERRLRYGEVVALTGVLDRPRSMAASFPHLLDRQFTVLEALDGRPCGARPGGIGVVGRGEDRAEARPMLARLPPALAPCQ